MAEKNRFSKLLEYLMSMADVKNYTIAHELQYDVSYISKWLSGRMIPSEKSEKKILEGISRCIVDAAGDTARDNLLNDYQVDNCEDLKLAIFDNLEAEYFYVRDLQKNTGADVAQKTLYFPELTLPLFISKMRHPVLRRVRSLNIMAAIDLLSMEHEYQLQIIQFENEHVNSQRGYPDVHYSMLIDIHLEKWDYINDTILLINLLEKNTCIDFQLYGETQASGRVIFAVKDDYVISGMLMGRDHCMAVVVSEELENCNTLYRNLKALCSSEKLLFRKIMMEDMLLNHDYIHSLLSLDLKWMIGHMTEHFLSDDLFEEIVEDLDSAGKLTVSKDYLRNIHRMTKNIVEDSHIKLLLNKNSLYNLVITNELDFYNHKVYLTAEQRIHYLNHFLSLCNSHQNLEVRLIYRKLVPDLEYTDNQCVFLSDTLSYLRLVGEQNNLLIINRSDMQEIFKNFFDESWNCCNGAVVSDKNTIIANINHVIRGIHLISGTD